MQKGRFNIDCGELYLIAAKAGLERRLEEELYSLAEFIRDHYDFKLFLEDPRVSAAYKKKRLKQLYPGGASKLFLALIRHLIDHGREELVEDISKKFSRQLYRQQGGLFAEISSVCPVPSGLKRRLQKVLHKIKGRPVELRYKLDPGLMGGLCIRFINGEVWDVSLKHKFLDLKMSIMK